MERLLEFTSFTLIFASFLVWIITKALQSKKVRGLLIELWMHFEEKKEQSGAEIILANRIFGAVYKNSNGGLSIAKFAFIIITLNAPFVLYYSNLQNLIYQNAYKAELEDIEKNIEYFGTALVGNMYAHVMDNAMIDLFVYTAAFLIGVVVFEYASYKMTSIFLSKAEKNKTFKYVMIDVVCLVSIYYLVPLIIYYNDLVAHFYTENSWSSVHAEVYFGFHMFPLAPVYYFINDDRWISNILVIPSVSVCLPTVIYILGVFIYYNKCILGYVSSYVERIERTNFKLMGSITEFLAILGSLVGTIIYFIPI